MSDESTNPTSEVHDVESAIKSLVAPPPKEKKRAPKREEVAPEEPEQETAEAPEAVEAEAEEPEAETEQTENEDESDTEDSDDTEQEETEEDKLYAVKVNGEEFDVNLSELIAGYQKNADYQRKTSALAEERRALQAQMQQVGQLREALEGELVKFSSQGNEKEPDWVKLANEMDPWEYQKARADWDAKARAKADAAQKANAMRMAQHQQTLLQNGQKLLDHFPEWKGNVQKFEADRAEMMRAAEAYGFTREEFLGSVDHRNFLMLRDAMKGRKLAQAGKQPPVAKKIPKKAPVSIQPGAKETTGERKARDRDTLRENLRKRGTVDDAVRYLLRG